MFLLDTLMATFSTHACRFSFTQFHSHACSLCGGGVTYAMHVLDEMECLLPIQLFIFAMHLNVDVTLTVLHITPMQCIKSPGI